MKNRENKTISESEAIERIKYRMYTAGQVAGVDEMEDLEMAIKVLEEIQQYRKHGVTIENALNNMCDLIAAENLLEKYRAIGAPEECLRNKDFLDFLADKMNPNDFETYLRLYNALEEKGCEE